MQSAGHAAHTARALCRRRRPQERKRPLHDRSEQPKPMTLVRTALIAPYRRLQAKADKSHGQDANRALKPILEGRFLAWTLDRAAGRFPAGAESKRRCSEDGTACTATQSVEERKYEHCK